MNAPQNIRDFEKRYNKNLADNGTTETKNSSYDPVGAHDPFNGMFGLRVHWFFAAMAVLALPLYGWTYHWWQSGSPFLIFVLLAGRLGWLSKSPKLLAWSIVNINIAYALFSTSWLFYRFFVITCYPTTFFLAILSSRRLRRKVRQTLRFLFQSFHFVDDRLAFFDLPAIDIDDGDVPCLLVIRGFTFTFSKMTLEVHGVEVGVKLNEDIEIAIQTDSFKWKIMRAIEIGDIYASLKGPFTPKKKQHHEQYQNNKDATNSLTDHQKPRTTRDLSEVKRHSDMDSGADAAYDRRLADIAKTNTTYQARKDVVASIIESDKRKAAIGAGIFADTSIPNPPKRQIKSSYLNRMVPSWIKKIFQQLPVLLRLFLNPVSYNHPVHFKSIVLTGCGKYLNQILDTQFFKAYPDANKEIRKLKEEVETFLVDGRFSVVLPEILGLASVPFLTQYDIITFVKAPRVLVHKSVQDEKTQIAQTVEEIAEIKGLAATFTIPSCLLPNHEYLLPDTPSDIHEKDQANVKMSILASLPGKFHQDMIHFAITVVKASQVLTLHKQANSMSEEVQSAGHFGKLLGQATKEQAKKKLVEAHVDDTWLYKLIIKGFNALKETKGDIGYQMDLPVELKNLRPSNYVKRSSMDLAELQESRRSSWTSNGSSGSEVLVSKERAY